MMRIVGKVLRSFEGLGEEWAENGQTYKSEACGAVLSVPKGGAGELVCCDQGMKQLTREEAKEY